MNKVILFNPRALRSKARIPNTVLQLAASIEGKFDWVIVDGNMESDPLPKILKYLGSGDFKYFCVTLMPGPQVKQALTITKKIRGAYPEIKIIWGGYFPSNHPKAVISSGYVDYIVYGPGDKTFPELLHRVDSHLPVHPLNNLIWAENGEMKKSPKDELYDQDTLPLLPYEKLNSFYPVKKYLPKTYLGNHTIGYHASVGCPFKCAFCGIVPIYEARWKGKSARKIFDDIQFIRKNFGGDSIEFHDNNFFVSEKRVIEFSELMLNENLVWWGEGRIDTIDKYSDSTLLLMREAGCKMIFFGAETGNDAILKKMDKGGTQTGEQIKSFAARMKKFDIIPEYSFVLGTPAPSAEEVMQQIEEDIVFIRTIKEINPVTEIIIYVYSPVPTEGSELLNSVKAHGFNFPETLDDWVSAQWENFDLRKNPLTPWLKPYMIDRIKNFETVLNGYYPTVSDTKLSQWHRKAIRLVSSWRYNLQRYEFPYEIKALQKFWLRYRQPEWEGF